MARAIFSPMQRFWPWPNVTSSKSLCFLDCHARLDLGEMLLQL